MFKFRVGDKVKLYKGSWSIGVSKENMFQRLDEGNGIFTVVGVPTERNQPIIEKSLSARIHDVMIEGETGMVWLHSSRYLKMHARAISYPVVARFNGDSPAGDHYVLFTSDVCGIVIHSGCRSPYKTGEYSENWASIELHHDKWKVLDRRQTKVLVDNLQIGPKPANTGENT